MLPLSGALQLQDSGHLAGPSRRIPATRFESPAFSCRGDGAASDTRHIGVGLRCLQPCVIEFLNA